MTQNSHYAEQSVVTDPGALAVRIEGAGRDLATLRRMVSGLLVHYRDPGLAGYGIPDERQAEIDTRYAERMLARLGELDAAPLGAERPHANRPGGLEGRARWRAGPGAIRRRSRSGDPFLGGCSSRSHRPRRSWRCSTGDPSARSVSRRWRGRARELWRRHTPL